MKKMAIESLIEETAGDALNNSAKVSRPLFFEIKSKSSTYFREGYSPFLTNTKGKNN
jgi:hypothetical protein